MAGRWEKPVRTISPEQCYKSCVDFQLAEIHPDLSRSVPGQRKNNRLEDDSENGPEQNCVNNMSRQ